MVLPDSHEIPRAPCYLGNDKQSVQRFVYGGHTLYAEPFKTLRLHHTFLTSRHHVSNDHAAPTTPTMQPLTGITHNWFSLIRFRSPLLTESRLLSLPVGTEMFHFPTFPLPDLYIQPGVTRLSTQPGFPIRKSSDHSLVIDSPRLIADSYVLLRFLVPRHPPCALKNLKATKIRCSRPLFSSQHTHNHHQPSHQTQHHHPTHRAR